MGDDSETYEGTLKSFSDKNGFGFIECAATKMKYGCDVFVHKNEGEKVMVGSAITFNVHLNKKGQPQANNVAPHGGGMVAGGMHGAAIPVAQQSFDGSSALAGPFLGTVKSNNPANGYGFITCAETQALYNADVYLNRTEGDGLQAGQQVYFQVQSTKDGKPQAVGVTVFQTKKRSYDTMNSGQGGPGQMFPTAGMKRPGSWETPSWQDKGMGKGMGKCMGKGMQSGPWQTGWQNSNGMYQGFVKSFNQEHGYGFIQCNETFVLYHSDIFLHQNEAAGLEVGSQVSFQVHFNSKGQPQANSVSALGGAIKRAKKEADSGSAPTPLHALPLFPDGPFTGMVKSYNASTGYGFIDCAATKELFSADVFLHKTQVSAGIDVGSSVCFQVRLNNNGQPQADNVVLEE